MSKTPKPKAPALPKPDFNAKAPHPDDFAVWCENPVTRFVAAAYARSAALQGDEWMRRSWTGAEADPVLLIELRTRADAYNAFLETGLEQYVNVLEQA